MDEGSIVIQGAWVLLRLSWFGGLPRPTHLPAFKKSVTVPLQEKLNCRRCLGQQVLVVLVVLVHLVVVVPAGNVY